MLSDALVERYSRQILLPEVGGRGQERLCAARVTVTGGGDAGAFAATLLAGAGAAVAIEAGPPDELRVTTAATAGVRARFHGSAAVVATLPGMPCVACLPARALGLPAADDAAAAPAVAQATGALVAAEALRLVLGLATEGRVHTVDVARGDAAAAPLGGTPGCVRCGRTS
jgi:molybdopterin/thiamine biosynthesis adenylyltransferase